MKNIFKNLNKYKYLCLLAVLVFLLIQKLSISSWQNFIFDTFKTLAVISFAFLIFLVAFNLFYPTIMPIIRNAIDFFDLLIPDDNKKINKGLRILIFNWRDSKHVWAGGAEVYVEALAKNWAQNGNTVTIFCGNDGRNKRNEMVNNVKVIRRGGFYTVYLWAVLYYIFKFRRNYDIIVDSENGIPFMTPLFTTKPIILLIHHVHQDIFIQYLKFPFSYFARFVEGKVMPKVYSGKHIVTVSKSTKEEIIKNHIGQKNLIKIINPGVIAPDKDYKKTEFPSFVYLGRLKPYKNIDTAIKAFRKIHDKYKNAKLFIVGEGDSYLSLVKLAQKLQLEKSVIFFKKVSERKKIAILSKSWVALQPSQVEGWGITVIEANSCKTPVIASNTNGLKDSILDGKTGFLVDPKNITEMSKRMQELLLDSEKRELFSQNAYQWARNFDWEKNSQEFYEILLFAFQNHRQNPWGARTTQFISRITSLF